jgi:transposase
MKGDQWNLSVRLHVVLANECKKNRYVFSGVKISLRVVLQCQLCENNWDRDKNACTNISFETSWPD